MHQLAQGRTTETAGNFHLVSPSEENRFRAVKQFQARIVQQFFPPPHIQLTNILHSQLGEHPLVFLPLWLGVFAGNGGHNQPSLVRAFCKLLQNGALAFFVFVPPDRKQRSANRVCCITPFMNTFGH